MTGQDGRLALIVGAVQAGMPPPECFYGDWRPDRTYPRGSIVDRDGHLWIRDPGGWACLTGTASWIGDTPLTELVDRRTARLREVLR